MSLYGAQDKKEEERFTVNRILTIVAPFDREFSVDTNCDAIFRQSSTCSRTEGRFFPGINMMTVCLLLPGQLKICRLE